MAIYSTVKTRYGTSKTDLAIDLSEELGFGIGDKIEFQRIDDDTVVMKMAKRYTGKICSMCYKPRPTSNVKGHEYCDECIEFHPSYLKASDFQTTTPPVNRFGGGLRGLTNPPVDWRGQVIPHAPKNPPPVS